jgi:nitroreductase
MTSENDPKVAPWQIKERDFHRHGNSREKLTCLLRYAILAPSSHNAQPWRFGVGDSEVRVHADRSRWLKVADADQRELHVSLGCALENLLITAEHFGYGHRTAYSPETDEADLVAVVALELEGEPSRFRPPELLEAIPARQTNHNVYDGRPIPAEDVARLEDCCVEDDILLHLTDDVAIKRSVDELVVRADAMQFADPAWREELG